MSLFQRRIKNTSWLSNNIPLFYMDIITHPRANTDEGLTNISQ